MINLLEQHAQVNKDTKEIVAIGYFPNGTPDDNIEIVEITSEQRDIIIQPGTAYLGNDGEIVLEKAEPPEEIEQPDYGTQGDPDNVTIIQAVTGIVQYITIVDPTPKETSTAVKHIGRLLLYLAKRWVRLV